MSRIVIRKCQNCEVKKYRKALEQIASLKVLQPEVGVAVDMARNALAVTFVSKFPHTTAMMPKYKKTGKAG